MSSVKNLWTSVWNVGSELVMSLGQTRARMRIVDNVTIGDSRLQLRKMRSVSRLPKGGEEGGVYTWMEGK